MEGSIADGAAEVSPFTPNTMYIISTHAPEASVLSAIPERKLSVPSFRAENAKSMLIITPARTAQASPRTQLPEKLDTSAPVSADTDIAPSILMLTMPAFLEIRAARAAKAIGRA